MSFIHHKLSDVFWKEKLATVKNITLPYILKQLKKTGRLDNFIEASKALKGEKAKFVTHQPYDDSDVYKTIEAIANVLYHEKDDFLENNADEIIATIAAAQEDDGYIYTIRTILSRKKFLFPSLKKWVYVNVSGRERWSKEEHMSHELYNAGHLYEAAVAYFKATGKRVLLDVALKNAALINQTFGKEKLSIPPGHQSIEYGLLKLFAVTNNPDWLDLASFFIHIRGNSGKQYLTNSTHIGENGQYWQNTKPIIVENEAVGHAVRAVYLYGAAAELARLTNNQLLASAVEKIWQNVVGKKIYLHGGLGSEWIGESFGNEYHLPNETNYSETCAAIGNIYWNQRMFELSKHAKYIDVLEKSLYNNVLSGLGTSGNQFFYTNPMCVRHQCPEHRSDWFEVPCCPPNISRLLSDIEQYIYYIIDNQLYVNLFINGELSVENSDTKIYFRQEHHYPANGKLVFYLELSNDFPLELFIRIPGFALGDAMSSDLYSFVQPVNKQVMVKVNGEDIYMEMVDGYIFLPMKFAGSVKIEIDLPFDIQLIKAHPKVLENNGMLAIQRGPIIFCAESMDNAGAVSDILMNENVDFIINNAKNWTEIEIKAPVKKVNASGKLKSHELKMIPYCMWANREPGEMMVWFPLEDSIPVSKRPFSGGYKKMKRIQILDFIKHRKAMLGQ